MTESISVRCCIAGGGPAGMMLGLLLGRAGIDALVLEKHGDFLRDFRGDTIHPSTLRLMDELGLLEDFLKLPHQRAEELAVVIGGRQYRAADFRHLGAHANFIAMMPQWDFLNFLAAQGARYPGFGLRMRAEATGLLEEQGRVVGITATTPEGTIEVRADLVVAADGRHSTVRAKAGLPVQDFGAPMDVLWFALSRRADDPVETLGYFDDGLIFIRINRGQHWQCGYVIAKGTLENLREAGLPAFRERVLARLPFVRDRIGEIASWDSVKLLTVQVDRLRRWHRPGLLCIGDAAHAMSPVGGVGINLAIQDAVAAANLLAGPLRSRAIMEEHLAAVQRRREFPTRATQWLQVQVQQRLISRVLAQRRRLEAPLLLRILDRSALLRRIPARVVGIGIRPEHIRI